MPPLSFFLFVARLLDFTFLELLASRETASIFRQPAQSLQVPSARFGLPCFLRLLLLFSRPPFYETPCIPAAPSTSFLRPSFFPASVLSYTCILRPPSSLCCFPPAPTGGMCLQRTTAMIIFAVALRPVRLRFLSRHLREPPACWCI